LAGLGVGAVVKGVPIGGVGVALGAAVIITGAVTMDAARRLESAGLVPPGEARMLIGATLLDVVVALALVSLVRSRRRLKQEVAQSSSGIFSHH
jgi:hypothetical protein